MSSSPRHPNARLIENLYAAIQKADPTGDHGFATPMTHISRTSRSGSAAVSASWRCGDWSVTRGRR